MYMKLKDLLVEQARVNKEIRKLRIENCRSYVALFNKAGIKDRFVDERLNELNVSIEYLHHSVVIDDILDDLEALIENVVDRC